tara:strand:+ start:15086 stop:15337 length:252 start_codon:yes stop_codon:yes gene_type:complete
MFRYADNGITVASIPDQRGAMKEGSLPVKIRVTFKRRRKYYSTEKDLNTEELKKLSETKSKNKSRFELISNTLLKKVKNAVIR